jgi:hypothetical protein
MRETKCQELAVFCLPKATADDKVTNIAGRLVGFRQSGGMIRRGLVALPGGDQASEDLHVKEH